MLQNLCVVYPSPLYNSLIEIHKYFIGGKVRKKAFHCDRHFPRLLATLVSYLFVGIFEVTAHLPWSTFITLLFWFSKVMTVCFGLAVSSVGSWAFVFPRVLLSTPASSKMFQKLYWMKRGIAVLFAYSWALFKWLAVIKINHIVFPL